MLDLFSVHVGSLSWLTEIRGLMDAGLFRVSPRVLSFGGASTRLHGKIRRKWAPVRRHVVPASHRPDHPLSRNFRVLAASPLPSDPTTPSPLPSISAFLCIIHYFCKAHRARDASRRAELFKCILWHPCRRRRQPSAELSSLFSSMCFSPTSNGALESQILC